MMDREVVSVGGVVSLEDMERVHILKVLREVGYNKSAASRILGISRFTLREKMKRYGIEEMPR
ncbi:MAG: hypothetical protein HY878_02095 [Deltaproteobacteria bacterium]|nr:hypothetical protein [Deltaproteobacteria bacterium]